MRGRDGGGEGREEMGQLVRGRGPQGGLGFLPLIIYQFKAIPRVAVWGTAEGQGEVTGMGHGSRLD